MDVWLALLLAADPGLFIGSGTDCPSAIQVLAQIAPLLPAGMIAAEAGGASTSGEAPDGGDVAIVAIDQQGDRWVRLRGRDERFNHERALPSSLSCAEAARTAAVLLAAWEFQGRASTTPPSAAAAPDTAPATPAGSGEPAKVTVVEIVRAGAAPAKTDPAAAAKPATPETATPAQAPKAPAAAIPPPPTAAIAAPARLAASPPPQQRRVGLGGGVSAAARTDRLVAAAAAEVIYGPPTGIGWRLQAATTARDLLDIGGGHAVWTRSSLGLGSSVTLRRGHLGVQAHGDALAAILSISGQDLATNEQGTQAAFGVAVGARGLIGLEGGDLWLDVTATTWPGRHQVLLRGASQGADLPAAELAAGIGVDFFVWP